MRSFYNKMISQLNSSSDKKSGPQVYVDFLLSLLGLAMLSALIWYFNMIDGLFNKIVIIFIYAVMSASLLLGSKSNGSDNRSVRIINIVLVLVLLAGLLIAISDRFGLDSLGLNVTMTIVSSPFLWIAWVLIRKKPLLAVGQVPTIIIVMAYLVMSSIPAGDRLDYLLLPLPIVLIAAIFWTLLAWVSLHFAERLRQCAVWGSAIESLTMALLFLPLIPLAALATRALTSSEIWLAVSVTIVSLLLGSVVSTPLRKFLLELGRLPPIRRRAKVD